jgi:hypothetical protein
MKNWHILYNTNTGKAVSIGTVITNPIPENLTALSLTDEQGDGLRQGLYKWDENLKELVPTGVTIENEL